MPLSGITLTIAAFATRIFSHWIAAPLAGIGLSIIITNLVKKGITCYDTKLLISIRKEIYKIDNKHKNLQLIAVICCFGLSFFCPTIGFATGLILGAYSAIIFDVERAKLARVKRERQNKHNNS